MTNKEAIIYLEWLSDIDFTKKYPKYPIVTKKEQVEALKLAITALQVLPSVQPERKTGKWIRNDNGTYSCDKCHSWIPEEQHYYAQYCLYCGADMRGEQDG